MVRRCIELVDHTCVKQGITGETSLFLFELPKLAQNCSGVLSNFHWLKLLDVELLGVTITRVLLPTSNITLEKYLLLGPKRFVKLNSIIWKVECVHNCSNTTASPSTKLVQFLLKFLVLFSELIAFGLLLFIQSIDIFEFFVLLDDLLLEFSHLVLAGLSDFLDVLLVLGLDVAGRLRTSHLWLDDVGEAFELEQLVVLGEAAVGVHIQFDTGCAHDL